MTAGLKWPPEMCPTAAMPATSVRPNASATPRKPTPDWLSVSLGKFAAKSAVPTPPRTSRNVPKHSDR